MNCMLGLEETTGLTFPACIRCEGWWGGLIAPGQTAAPEISYCA